MDLVEQPGSAVALSPSQRFDVELENFTPNLRHALPATVSTDKFKRVLLTAISQNPALFTADRRSLFNSASKCATDGLLPDGREAALVVFNTTVTRRGDDGIDREFKIPMVQYMPMVAGIRKRMRNSGDVLSAVADVVYKNDRFEYRLGDDAMIRHEPPPLGEERGEAVGAYAIIRLKSGETLRDVMSKKDIELVRGQSRAKDSLMWKTFWGEGAKKTVLRRCAKMAPQSAEVEALLEHEDDAPMSTHDLAALPAPEREPQQEDFIDQETGEIIEAGDPETEQASPAAETPGAGGKPALVDEPRQGNADVGAAPPDGAASPAGSPPAQGNAPAATAAPATRPQAAPAPSAGQLEATKRWKELRDAIAACETIPAPMGVDGIEGSLSWIALDEIIHKAEPAGLADGAMRQLRGFIDKRRAELIGRPKDGGY